MAKSKSARSKRKTAKKAPARKAQPRRRTAPRRAKVSRKKAAKKKARRTSPVRKSAARKAPAKKAPAKKAAAKKAPAKKTPVKKTAAAKKTAPKPARKPLPRNARSAKLNAEAARKLPALNRERRRLAESDEERMPSAPSSLGYARGSSAARSGRGELRESLTLHTETSPALTGGDIDADWEDAYAVGDEAPGGDNPTPDQDRVDDIGKALGVQYNDNEELKGSDKIAERDKHRWELDPASSDDYRDRGRDEED